MSASASKQANQERERALKLLEQASRLIDAKKGSVVFSFKHGQWIFSWCANGSVKVTEAKTGTVYAVSKPGEPLTLSGDFKPVSLATP
jgi:hypothetical protein